MFGGRPECLGNFGDKERTCRLSMMFLECISYHGVGTLITVHENINTEKYISILDDNLWPVHLGMCQEGQMNGNETIPLVLYYEHPKVQTRTLLKIFGKQ